MKILAIGDFHGKFPAKLQRKIKKIKPDVILSQGDYCGNKLLYKLFFKHLFAKAVELWEIIGKSKTKKLELKNRDSGIRVVKKLNSFKVPVFGIAGNQDPVKFREIGTEGEKSKWDFYNQDLLYPKLKKFKSMNMIDYKLKKFNELNFLGYTTSSYPGIITKAIKKKFKNKYEKKEYKKRIKKRKKDYKIHKNRLVKLFKKAKKTKKPIIFISHNAPYMTKLDKIKSKKAHKLVKGEHYGSYLVKEMIKKYQPLLTIVGHMHENIGKIKIGKTLVINPGAAENGKAALIEIDEKRGKVKKIKFLR